jgi:hypothetical protein
MKLKSKYKVCHYYSMNRSKCFYFDLRREADDKMNDISFNNSSTLYELVGNKFKAIRSIKKKVM